MIWLLLICEFAEGVLLVGGLTPEVVEYGSDVDETIGWFVKVAGGMALMSSLRPSTYWH